MNPKGEPVALPYSPPPFLGRIVCGCCWRITTYETSHFKPPSPLSTPPPFTPLMPCRLNEKNATLTWPVLRHLDLSLWPSLYPLSLSLTHTLLCPLHTLPLSLLLSLFAPLACAFPSRGTTMKTNAFRTERTQIWNNFLLVKRSKGQEDHLPYTLHPPPPSL